MDLVQGQGSTELFQAQSHLHKHIFGFVSSIFLKCAVQLGIADIIKNHGRPTTLPELVSALQIHIAKTSFIQRLMRLLTYSGIFTATKVVHSQEEEEAYDLTPSSRLLLKDKVPSMSAFVLGLLDPAFVTPCHFLANWLRKNDDQLLSSPIESAFGMNLWDYATKSAEFNDVFNEAMASDSEMIQLAVKDCKPVFEGSNSLVDVGGGTGKTSRIITEAFPHLKCTVLDLPHVVANLEDTENVKFIEGDMFQHIPPADAVLLKLVLHDWSDEECLKILKKCREAISSNGKGKVIIIEMVLNENKECADNIEEAKLLCDLLLMAVLNGRERSEKDWKNLFLKAGFSHYKITNMFGLKSLIEVFP